MVEHTSSIAEHLRPEPAYFAHDSPTAHLTSELCASASVAERSGPEYDDPEHDIPTAQLIVGILLQRRASVAAHGSPIVGV